jgi:hypothetical protein
MNYGKKPGQGWASAFVAMNGMMQSQKGFLTHLFRRLSIQAFGLDIT